MKTETEAALEDGFLYWRGFLKAREDDCNTTVPFLLVHNGMADKLNICCGTPI
jgi:hypothetical protein